MAAEDTQYKPGEGGCKDTRFKPGQSGNPKGSSRAQIFLNAVLEAIKVDDGKRVQAAANQLLDQAAEGQPWAIQMLAERLDGKVPQAVTGANDGPLVFEQIRRVVIDPVAADFALSQPSAASTQH